MVEWFVGCQRPVVLVLPADGQHKFYERIEVVPVTAKGSLGGVRGQGVSSSSSLSECGTEKAAQGLPRDVQGQLELGKGEKKEQGGVKWVNRGW